MKVEIPADAPRNLALGDDRKPQKKKKKSGGGVGRTTTVKSVSKGAKAKALTQQDIVALRGHTLRVVNRRLADAGRVLEGKKEWSNQQVRLFGMLLAKVMPDLHHSVVQGEFSVESKVASELTREELEAIAAQGSRAGKRDDEIMDAEYEDVTDETMRAELEMF